MNTESQLTPARIQLHLRSRFNPIRNLTPQLLASYLDAYDAGYIAQFALAAETIERRDDLLKSVVPKRKKAVTRHGWEILTTADTPAAKRQQEALTFLYNQLTASHALNRHQRGGVKLLLRQMMDAPGKEFAVHELIWKPLGRGRLTVECRFVPLWFFENTKGELRFLESEGAVEGTPLEEGGWMVAHGDALMIPSAICYMFKRLPLQDWLAFSEKFGFPGVLGKTDGQPGSEQWDAMAAAVKVFANDFAAVCNRSEEITLVETAKGGTGNLPMPGLVEAMNRSMAAIWRGGDLGTMSKDGQAVGSNPQEAETEMLEQDDAEMLEETAGEYISKPALRYLFGPDTEPLAYLKILTARRQNVAQEILVDTFLRDSGAPLAVAATLERYGRGMPKEGEPLLGKPAAPAPPAAGDFANDSSSAGHELVFQSLAQDFAPLVARLKAIEAIEDADVQQAKLRELLADWDRLTRSLTADPTAARALEQASTQALFSGLAGRVQTQ